MKKTDSRDFNRNRNQTEDFLDDMDYQDEPDYEEDEFTLELGEDFEAIVDDVMKEQSGNHEDEEKTETKVDKVLSMLLQAGGLAIGALSVALTVIVWNGVHGGNTDIRVSPSTKETTTEPTTVVEQNILDGTDEVSTFAMEFISSVQEAGDSYQWNVKTEDETTTQAVTEPETPEPETTEPIIDETEETISKTTKKPKPTKKETTSPEPETTTPEPTEETTTPKPADETTPPEPTDETTPPESSSEDTTAPSSVAE